MIPRTIVIVNWFYTCDKCIFLTRDWLSLGFVCARSFIESLYDTVIIQSYRLWYPMRLSSQHVFLDNHIITESVLKQSNDLGHSYITYCARSSHDQFDLRISPQTIIQSYRLWSRIRLHFLGNTVVTASTIPTNKYLSYHNIIINIAVLFTTEETTVQLL